jgi:FlaA1/EpsC-like NDP-sugar epimerase
MDFEVVSTYNLFIPISVITFLNIFFFKAFRTSEGIIRLSSAQEGLRCISAVFWSCFVLLISVGISAMAHWNHIVPLSVILIYFFIASFLLFAYRVWVKQLYNRSIQRRLSSENVVVFGRTKDGALLKRAIESINGRQYNVIGFMDEDPIFWGKSIDHVKIYPFEYLKELVKKYPIETLFLSSDDIDLKLKNKIVDYCLEAELSIKVIPAVQKWVDGQLQNKQIKDLKIEDLLNRPSIQLAPEHLQNYLAGKRILVTGAAGSIGSEIVKQLAGINIELLILCDNRETGLYELQYQLSQQLVDAEKIIVRISDVRNADIMDNLFATYRPQIVFHAAAYKHVPLMETHPCQAVLNNIKGTKILANLSITYGIKRFVMVSTDKAINPTNVMGATKRVAEMYVAELQKNQENIPKVPLGNFDVVNQNGYSDRRGNTKFITTRFGNVLGSNGSVIPRFQSQIEKGGPVTVTHPDITRYFMTIPEACSLVLEAGTMGHGGEIFVFDMGEPVKIIDLARKMIKLAGLIPGKDIQIEYSGLRPGEKLYEELLSKDEESIPTHHKKIMISKVSNPKSERLFENIDYLIELAESNKMKESVMQMKIIVPEYKSKNSEYEELDKNVTSDVYSISG